MKFGIVSSQFFLFQVPLQERMELFLRVADIMATKKRADLNATTMLGQSKTIIQVHSYDVMEHVNLQYLQHWLAVTRSYFLDDISRLCFVVTDY